MKINSAILSLLLLIPFVGHASLAVVDVQADINAKKAQAFQTMQIEELKKIQETLEAKGGSNVASGDINSGEPSFIQGDEVSPSEAVAESENYANFRILQALQTQQIEELKNIKKILWFLAFCLVVKNLYGLFLKRKSTITENNK